MAELSESTVPPSAKRSKTSTEWAWKREGLPTHLRFDAPYFYRMGLGTAAGAMQPALPSVDKGSYATLADIRAELARVETALDSALSEEDETRLSEELNTLHTQHEEAMDKVYREGTAEQKTKEGGEGEATGAGTSLQRVDQTREGGICSTVWDSSIVMSKMFERWDEREPGCFKGKRVLELGAGCGLTGLVLGRLGAEVSLTDLEPARELLHRNAVHNLGSGGA